MTIETFCKEICKGDFIEKESMLNTLTEYEQKIRADVIEEIKELAQLNLIEAMDLENATKYGNKNAEQQDISYGTLMRYEIADYVDDFMDSVEELKVQNK